MASFSNSQTPPWTLTTKSTFQTELLAVPYAPILEEKIHQLAYDPYPDGRNRKALTGTNDEIYMLRLGEYAAFYTIQKPFVSLLALRYRQTFASPDGFPSPDEVDQLLGKAQTSFPWQQVRPSLAAATKPQPQPIPKPLTKEFLSSLRIPAQYHPILQRVQTRAALLNCPGIPPQCIQRLDTSLFEPPLAQVQQEATYVLSRASDLQRLKDGSLHTFLLLLAPEQEKAVTWAATASGPVQVKGKPGTGKSTVALYRIRSFIQKQQESGQGRPRVLFTTFNNTLAETSKQLLELLLENQIHCVQVSTADKLITNLFRGNLQKAEDPTQVELLRRALRQIIPEEARKQEFLNKYSEEYLLEEMNKLIIARKISTETSYLSFERAGRKVALREGDRRIIWHLYELYCELLRQHRQETWSQWRVRAEEYLLKQTDTPTYDAVFIDEAQDLEPSAIRILFRLCKTPNRFFITADANQSIYNKGFSWVGYLLEGKGYLPDFYLPRQNCFIEIKPKQPSTEELEKTRLLALYTGKEVYTLYGDVWLAQQPLYRQACCYTPPKMYAHTPNGQPGMVVRQETADSQEVALLLQKLNDVGLLVRVEKEMITLSFTHNFATESFRAQEYLPTLQKQYEHIAELSPQLQQAHDKLVAAFIGYKGSKGVFVRQQLSWDFAWAACSACQNLELCDEQEEDGEEAFLHESCSQIPPGKYVYDSPRLKAAYEAARRERFST